LGKLEDGVGEERRGEIGGLKNHDMWCPLNIEVNVVVILLNDSSILVIYN
jgi:hypothetical protein